MSDVKQRDRRVSTEDLSIRDLMEKKVAELYALAKEMEIPYYASLRKHELVKKILERKAQKRGLLLVEGALDITNDNYGFLRQQDNDYTAGPGDIYVSASQINRFGLRTGDYVTGYAR
ncbi:MAG: Rho termination factor N-terminal domain-containing protein, partial [Candidatus Hydrothermae bacterium]|nr:Rho termination factor N-terminal domain-containing protein [Candidatus Hydrothermae bacterium]